MSPLLLRLRRRSAFGASLGLAVLAWSSASIAQVGAEKSAAMLKVAEGLEARLFASEPMVNNPTNIDVDSRGRVWVAEGQNYRMTHRKDLPRIEGADRIKILEDTDGDGRADKVTVFADGIYPIPMGLAVEEVYGPDGKYKGAKVYVGNSPDILVFEDTDGDDKADKKSVLLTGFGGVDSDHGVHGMTLGLDGKLYFTHGDGCCSFEAKDGSHPTRNFDVVDASGRHVSSSNLANTLRVNRDGTEFEILADRQRNNYETSLNAFGNAFTSDNDDDGNRGSRVIWVMDGGSYGYRTPGSPRHWGEEVPGIVPKLVGTGNGSPCGIMVYEGSLLGAPYKGGLFEADAGTRQINFFPIQRHASSFRTDYKVLLGSDDPWFRPVDMTAAPDGSIFVADWYDAGVGGHAFRDQDTGRIYRVAPKGSKPSIARPDFATIPGLIALLKSPVVASQDAARRSLIGRGAESKAALAEVLAKGDPVDRARALWVLAAIEGDSVAVRTLKDGDPRIREQAVRILGRDLGQVGTVVFTRPEAKKPHRALLHLNDLLPMADDPDAGVRRELILALRWLPTARVGEALKHLAKHWDGQDRWYLEALGLALLDRESFFLSELFDGALFGHLDLDRAGQEGAVAVPPYFPADRNEAYIATGTPDLPANPLSKTLGLAWRVHRPESLPLLRKIAPTLAAPELQQAFDDVISRDHDKEAGVLVAEQALRAVDPARRLALMTALGRNLGPNGPWKEAKAAAPVVRLIESSLDDPTTRLAGIALAVNSYDSRYGPTLLGYAKDPKAADAVRLAAVEAVGRIRPAGTPEFIDALIAEAKKKGSTPLAEAAVRALPDLPDSNNRLLAMIAGDDYPLGLRREALRVYARPRNGGGRKVIELIKEQKLPDELKSEATSIAHNDPDGRVRGEAAGLLPLPKAASGRPLPTIRELVGRNGDAARGRLVFARSANDNNAAKCTTCHRVQGQGQWVGPDLSTIGTKYGKEELLRSILYPSAAIGYNYRSNVLATADGRVLTGLILEEGPDRVVLKTVDGQRHTVRPSEIEDRKVTEVSLMPEGLAEAMTDGDLVDLLAFLATLKEPVSIVGQYQVVGPVADPGDAPLTPKSPPPGGKLTWRRALANAEGQVDLTSSAGDVASKFAFLETPVLAPEDLEARLVLDSGAGLKAWLDGKELAIPDPSGDQPRAVAIRLSPRGAPARHPGGRGFEKRAGDDFRRPETARVPYVRGDGGLGALKAAAPGASTHQRGRGTIMPPGFKKPGSTGLSNAPLRNGRIASPPGARPGPIGTSTFTLTPEQQELALDLTQLALDIVGAFEVPAADGANALISLGRKDWIGAGLSSLSMIPILGEVAKAGKVGKWLRTVNESIRVAREDSRFAALLRPALANIRKLLGHLPTSHLPKGLAHDLEEMKASIDAFLKPARSISRFDRLVEDLLVKRFGSAQNVGTRVVENVKVAAHFFEENGVEFEKMNDYLKGMDLHAVEKVEEVIFMKGEKVWQYVDTLKAEGMQTGEWFTEARGAVSHRNLGISGAGRQVREFEVTKTVKVLKSRAAPIKDTWTKAVSGGIAKTKDSAWARDEAGRLIGRNAEMVSGGGVQYLLPGGYKVLKEVR